MSNTDGRFRQAEFLPEANGDDTYGRCVVCGIDGLELHWRVYPSHTLSGGDGGPVCGGCAEELTRCVLDNRASEVAKSAYQAAVSAGIEFALTALTEGRALRTNNGQWIRMTAWTVDTREPAGEAS